MKSETTHKITAMGTGSAFTLENYHTNFLVEDRSGKKLMIDCGGDARHALRELSLGHGDVGGVYVSHLHGDHVGGLEWLGFATFFDPSCGKPELFVSGSLKSSLWSNVLSGGMGSLQGRIMDLEDYFAVRPIGKNEKFKFLDDAEFQLVQTCHVMNGFHIVPLFGLLATLGGTVVFFTTDTQYAPEQISDFYAMADVIVHDCEASFAPDGSPVQSKVHAHYVKLRTLPAETKVKMWLTHFQDGAPDRLAPADDGFKGFMLKGQSVEV